MAANFAPEDFLRSSAAAATNDGTITARHAGKMNAAFCDGHVAATDPGTFNDWSKNSSGPFLRALKYYNSATNQTIQL